MEEENKRETRQRSRSKTPLTLRSSVDRDIDIDGEKKKVKKNPTVETINEESPAPVVTQRSTRTKRNAAKATTNDVAESNSVNKETVALIANSVAVVPQAISATEQTVTKTTTVISSKTVKTSSGEQLSNEKQHQSQTVTKSTRSREANQNESNLLLEQNAKLKTSTPRANKDGSSANSNNSSFNNISITNGTNLEDHAAFKEYKEAGEYWNKFPKTDYTYSKLSQQRREVKPGVIAMPNMSRRSLEHHQTRVNDMIRRDPAQESFFRSRYEALTTLRKRRAAENYYDSQDETDISFGLNGSRSYIDSRSYFQRVITVITTFFSTIYYRTTSIFRREQPNVYYARYAEPQKGIIRRSWDSICGAFLSVFRYIYLCISSILFLDSWALQSSSKGNKKKGFLIGLLILLPLLLLAAWNLSEESDRILYRKHVTDTLSTIPSSLPSFPDSVHGTFDEFATRTAKVIPIALALIRTQTSNVSDKLKFLFDFNWNWLPNLWQSRNYQITNNIKASLSPEEYQNILGHIDAYIETVINKKVQTLEEERLHRETIIDQKLALRIATIVKEQIITYKYTLTNEDIERIAEVVRLKLADELKNEPKILPFVLSQDNLEEISKIVKQNIEIHHHEWIVAQKTADTPSTTDIKDIDIDEILYKILSSSKLNSLIDQRIDGKVTILTGQLSDHQSTIDQLQNDVNDLKEKFRNVLTANIAIQTTVDQLQGQQHELDEKIVSAQKQNNEQLEKFLQEIDAKLGVFNENQFNAIDNHIRIILADILGYKSTDGKPLENADLTNWIRSVFVAKELLEERLFELNSKFDDRIHDEINQSADILIKSVSDTIKKDIMIAIEEKQKKISATGHADSISLDEVRIRAIIKDALAVYDADKTGMVDYALESAGGEVLSTRCTESFNVKSAEISIFGVPLWYKSNTPRTVISPAVQPGECWSFQGFPGYLVLKLNNNVFVTGFTMEHIPKSLAPNGRIDSAPKLFTVWGLETVNDGEPHQFGEYEYLENGTSLQYFPVKNYDAQNVRSHNLIELRIESNHGNNNYTCLYRFRVHGTLTPSLS
ncbi:uncharacterized protein LOC116345911 [Contarinia nasturtii]|uniref:uncharacterized protein LOC116345911 n=1 Tax=Contarinia nasturtii TaxID=265458 RepID=UPI0012D37D3B|nr:uncharacterized protein LOC116345911 [Contarinia nasturtii]XP_031631537.1 uncharacterized protein LOC116345911 [Contarinia nasturtii]XP_031631538.1 uncharacterized protein LOC116345911 [Contarinia nasturtii]